MEEELQALRTALEKEQKKNRDLEEELRLTEEEKNRYVSTTQLRELTQGATGMSIDLSRKLRTLQKVNST